MFLERVMRFATRRVRRRKLLEDLQAQIRATGVSGTCNVGVHCLLNRAYSELGGR